ncbi:MAG: helix-hairpin-helix domain-containing protein [Anaerolineae bacterium]
MSLGNLFAVLLIVVAVIALFLPRLTRKEEEETSPAPPPPADAEVRAVRAAPVAQVIPTKPDDLTHVEGIGPKISGVLQAAGITTFAALSAADADRLRDILRAADPRLARIANPATWPQQAQLAAAGKWDDLQALQDTLKGGRVVR